MRKKQPEHLGKVISNVLQQLGLETRVKEHEAIVKWPDIVGEKVSKVTEAKKAVDGVLFVSVKSSAWRTELIFLKKGILRKIEKAIGAGIIKDIRFI